MWLRFFVLACLTLCYLEYTDAVLPGAAWFAGVVVDNAKDAGAPLPGYMNLLSSRSNFLTNLIHYLFGNKLEDKFQDVIRRCVDALPESVPIPDVDASSQEKMTFKNGVLLGLGTIKVQEGKHVQIIWSSKGFPIAIVPVTFTNLRIKANIKKTFTYYVVGKTVEGPVEMKFLQNNFVLKFHLYPGLFEWCYLKLYDVLCTDLEELLWDVKKPGGSDDWVGESAMQNYFASTEGLVEEHIKTTITNEIFHEIPTASPAICDTSKKQLRPSKYETFKIKHETKVDDGVDRQKAVEEIMSRVPGKPLKE